MTSARAAMTGIALALLLAAPAPAAVSRTDPGQIRAAAERYLAALATPGTTVHATAGSLDPRLSLAACDGVLTPFLAPGVAVRPRTLVGVRCPDAGGWTIYVPVALETEASVLVARRNLARGEVPPQADVEGTVRKVPGLGTQFATRRADIDGRRLRRPIAAGAPLPLDAFETPRLVERGQEVTVVAAMGGIAVRAGAVALEPGGHGDRIRARNLVSGRIVEGVVQADGTLAAHP